MSGLKVSSCYNWICLVRSGQENICIVNTVREIHIQLLTPIAQMSQQVEKNSSVP